MSSDSGDRRQDVNHVVEQLLGGSAPPRARDAPKQKRTDRVHLRVVEEPVAWMPKAGLPEGGRDECRNGERPCPYVRCKWHLWLVLGSDRRGRRHGAPPPTTLLPAWLEYPTPACCALDIAESLADDEAEVYSSDAQGNRRVASAHKTIRSIANALHLSPGRVNDIVAQAVTKLRELRDATLAELDAP